MSYWIGAELERGGATRVEQRLLGERRAGQLLTNCVRAARNMHIVEVAFRAVEVRHRQQRLSDGCGLGGFLEPGILRAVVADVVVGGNHPPRRRELAAHELRDGEKLAGRKAHRDRCTARLGNAGRRREPLGHVDRRAIAVDRVVTAGDPAARQKAFLAVAVDELQGAQLPGAVVHRDNQRVAVAANAVRLNLLAHQVRMRRRCRLCGLPQTGRSDRRRLLSLLAIRLALLLRLLHAADQLVILVVRHLRALARAPRLGESRAPAAERAGRDAVQVQHVPARLVARLAVCGETMQRAVCRDRVRDRQTGARNRRAELREGVH